MKYLPRRLSIITHGGAKEISQDQFLALDGPLVILGEPGAGKSEFVKQVQEVETSQFYTASGLNSFAKGISINGTSRIIIDALDEVTAYSRGGPIASILSKIQDEDVSKYIFTCRAVDWNHEVNSSIFITRWKKAPTVGRLLPLNDNEIITFVDYNGSDQKGKDFFRSAVEHDSVEILRNPQMLVMLMKTVNISGWPKTRLELFEETCKELVKEQNPFHKSSDFSYSTGDLLLAAGAIGAQMILSNKASINLDGTDASGTVTITELASDKYDVSVIKAAVSTKIFRGITNTSVECSHRTILEYLAARFIAAELQNTLSLRRLETILYAQGYIVPPALRGLHAWIATINNGEIARALIDRDPYGVFRYGDPAVLSTEISRHLLHALRKLSLDDPYFRNEDWHVRVGKGFAKPALREDILSLLKEPGVPFEMTHLILESLRGVGFVNSLKKELVDVVLNPSEIFVVRDAALAVLQDDQVQANWKKLVKELRAIDDMDALRLALDIVQFSTPEFSGTDIASVLIAISNASRRGTLYGGLGYGLPEKMSNEQLLESLDELLRHRFDENFQEPMYDDPKDWILQILLKCFERNALPEPEIIWMALNRLKRHSHSNWMALQEQATRYFDSNPSARIAVQWEALFGTGKEVDWSNFFRLQEACKSLAVGEADLLSHLARVMRERGKLWTSRWRTLAWYTVRDPSFKRAIKEIRKHIRDSSEFAEILAQLEKPQDLSWKRQERKGMQQWEKQQKQRIADRHAQYSGVIESLKKGTHLQAISFIAQAYLNWHFEIKGKDAEGRVADLVGEKNRKIALKSIAKSVGHATIPSVAEITDFHIASKFYHVEPILIAYCSQLRDKTKLSIQILLAALAACRWGSHFINDDITPSLQADLEKIIFRDVSQKESFLRDTFERQLRSFTEHISGLDRMATDEVFSDIAGRLSIEWLAKYDHKSDWVIEQLLKSAFRYGTFAEIISLAIDKLGQVKFLSKNQNDVWASLLFLIDFDNHKDRIYRTFTDDCDKFWALKESYSKYFKSKKLSPDQNYFVIKFFSPCFSDDDTVPAGFVGSQHPWEACEFLRARANELAADLSDRATELLQKLVSELQPSTRFYNHLKHVYSQHTQWIAEKDMQQVSLEIVKPILFGGVPSTLRDLQSIVLDQLADYQRRLQGSPTDDYKVFWNEKKPHSENYGRNRIVQGIDPLMNRFVIRAHIESQMPNVKRCDFLNTFANMDAPVEVKGQWHKDVWTAATSQLEDYSREYRADGYGIYLVLWFGHIEGSKKNPRKDPLNRMPRTADEMYHFLIDNYRDKISEKTKIFVLDISMPKGKAPMKSATRKISKNSSRKTASGKKAAAGVLPIKKSLKKKFATHNVKKSSVKRNAAQRKRKR